MLSKDSPEPRTSSRRALFAMGIIALWLGIGAVVSWLEAVAETALEWRYPVAGPPYRDGATGLTRRYDYALAVISSGTLRGDETATIHRPGAGDAEGTTVQARDYYEQVRTWRHDPCPEAWQLRLAEPQTRFFSAHLTKSDVGGALWSDVLATHHGWPLRAWSAWYWRYTCSAQPHYMPNEFEDYAIKPLYGIPAGRYVQPADSGQPGLVLHDRLLPIMPSIEPLAANAVFYALAAWAVVRGPRHLVQLIRLRRGLCASCGYDVRGLSNETLCPECGRSNPARSAARSPHTRPTAS